MNNYISSISINLFFFIGYTSVLQNYNVTRENIIHFKILHFFAKVLRNPKNIN